MHLVDLSIFWLNNVTIRPTKIINRDEKNWAHFERKKYFKNQNFQKIFLIKVDPLFQYSTKNFFLKDSTNFQHWKMTLKIRILRCSRRLFIILVSLMVTLFSEKMLISNRCIHGFMSNSNKKSWKDSNTDGHSQGALLGIAHRVDFFVCNWSDLILPLGGVRRREPAQSLMFQV
jgi:hypothetical protein